MIIKNYSCINNANIKCGSLTKRKKSKKRTGGHMHITYETQTNINNRRLNITDKSKK